MERETSGLLSTSEHWLFRELTILEMLARLIELAPTKKPEEIYEELQKLKDKNKSTSESRS